MCRVTRENWTAVTGMHADRVRSVRETYARSGKRCIERPISTRGEMAVCEELA